MSVYRLKGTAGPVINQAFHLSESLLIGRADDCDIRVAEEGIAPHHARVSLSAEGQVSVLDLGSANGILLNGEKISEAILASGDELRVGSCRLMLQAPGLRPQRVLKDEAIRPRINRRPWLLAGGLIFAAAIAWKAGALQVWISELIALLGR